MQTKWIAADWGTSNLRVWAIGADGAILAKDASDQGMGRLTPDTFEAALLDLIEPWLGQGVTPVIACGMVGARQGWIEAPYRATPCQAVDAKALTLAPTRDPRIQVAIAPGLSQARPADVMRGEETQIAGVLLQDPKFDGVLCLPGTHSKWAHISAEEVVSFQTFMTGELFELLSRQSVLRHGLAADGLDEAAFDEALSDAISNPAKFAARLFGLRAEGLLNGLSPLAARSRLSGMLIGIELAAAKPYWLGQAVSLIATSSLAASYARALGQQGVQAKTLDATACTLAGLSSIFKAQAQS